MNKLHDLFLLTVAFVVVICISVGIRTNLDASTASTQPNITIDLPSDLPGDLRREDGWHFYIYGESRGVFCYKNQCLVARQTNDYYVTPWDNCYWHHINGWQFNTVEGPIGVKLELPDHKASIYGEMPNIFAIDISRTYKMGDWKHYIKHLVPPGDRYLHVGHLYYNGHEVKDAHNYNDYMKTPWGNLYWVGKTRITRYGPQGWMRTPNTRFPIGQEVFPVDESDYDFT